MNHSNQNLEHISERPNLELFQPTPGNDIQPKLTSPEAQQATMGIFRSNRLVVRAMDAPRVNPQGMYDYEVWNHEIDIMSSDYGLRSASTTLLVPGESVATYKSYGMMFDGGQLETLHIHPTDSNSNGDLNDRAHFTQWSKGTPGMQSYDELATHTRVTHSNEMNEINANIPLHALRGIFAHKAPTDIPVLDALVSQRHLSDEYDLAVPIFLYDRSVGQLQELNLSPKDVEAMIQNYKPGSTSGSTLAARQRYRDAILGENLPQLS